LAFLFFVLLFAVCCVGSFLYSFFRLFLLLRPGASMLSPLARET
jgi:hypothetical protein